MAWMNEVRRQLLVGLLAVGQAWSVFGVMIGEYFRGAFLRLAGGQSEGLPVCRLTASADATLPFIDRCDSFGTKQFKNNLVLDLRKHHFGSAILHQATVVNHSSCISRITAMPYM